MRLLFTLVLVACALSTSSWAETRVHHFGDGPTYRASSPQQRWEAALDTEKLQTEHRDRELKYSLVALGSGIGIFGLWHLFAVKRRRIAASTDAAFISVLASVVRAKRRIGLTKRRIGQKIEDRIQASGE